MAYKTMFRLGLSLLLVFYCVSGWAQTEEYDLVSTHAKRNSASVEATASQETNWMKRKLNLSEKQYGQVGEINLYYARLAEEKQKIEQRQLPTPGELKQIVEENEKLVEEKENWYKLVLTPNQWHTYQKKKKYLPQHTPAYGARFMKP